MELRPKNERSLNQNDLLKLTRVGNGLPLESMLLYIRLVEG